MTAKRLKKFKVTASIIGPYLPTESTKIDKFTLKKVDKKVSSLIPPRVKVSAINEALIVINHEVEFDSEYIVEWEVHEISSKVAQEKGKVDLNKLVACLVLPASSYKYYAEIVRIEHLNPRDTGPDPESAASPPVHVLSYEPKDLLTENKRYFEILLSLDDKEVQDLLERFYKGIVSEVTSAGESNLSFYKILEDISHKTLKRLRKTEVLKEPDYSKVLKKIEALFSSNLSQDAIAKSIKKHNNELRALDYEQIGERILLTAKIFNMDSEVQELLKNINRYRAKVLAHPGSNTSQVKLSDHRDIREMARLFLLHYVAKFFNIEPPHYIPVKENDSWYRATYFNSAA